MRRLVRVLVILTIVGTACAPPTPDTASAPSPESSRAQRDFAFPPAPAVSDEPLDARVDEALDTLVVALAAGSLDLDALELAASSKDARLGWFISDLLRFVQGGPDQVALVDAFRTLTALDPENDPTFNESPWRSVTDHLMAWDLPAPPGYRELKADLFLVLEPGWRPFFADANSAIDWRLVSWGGVLIDDRPAGDPNSCPRGCIPALDDPSMTAAPGGDWYPDDRIVFGIVVGAEAVAFPKNIMEVHEMVNVTIGGRRLGIPYCTLCGSAQAYFTDSVPPKVQTPVLRTSGLLSRSNKVMYDLNTTSVFDTFTGEALSGPLHEGRVVLDQATVVASTWGEWKKAHPDTRIVAQDGGIGRSYPADPLGGRDDDGPIFPIGPVDPRLPVQSEVVGVIATDGTPVAFPIEQARATLKEGNEVTQAGIEVVADGSGLRARTRTGEELPAHQSFWFAWSQFHPDTVVWTPLGR